MIILLALAGLSTSSVMIATSSGTLPIRVAFTKNTPRMVSEVASYYMLFRHVRSVKEFADETVQKGEDVSFLRSYFTYMAGLDRQQSQTLETIAIETLAQVAEQDARAQTIIDEYDRQFPGGKIPSNIKMPPPPPQLKILQQEKDAMLLKGRDRLQMALGKDGFDKLTTYIAREINPKITIK